MNLGTYGILIAFGLFVLIMILNPRLSCFGKRVRSPLYPLLRKRKKTETSVRKTEDYGFRLVDNEGTGAGRRQPADQAKDKAAKKAEDYGFRLD